MKAYRIDWVDHGRARMLDVTYGYQMPKVECRNCEPEFGSWGQSMLEFPAVRGEFLMGKEFTFERVVCLREFRRLKGRIESAIGRHINLVPGCSIGEPTGVAQSAMLPDFVWGSLICPQISRRAHELLEAEGVKLRVASCPIRHRGKQLDSHLSIQAEPLAMLTEKCLSSLQIAQCPICGDFKQPAPTLSRVGSAVRRAIPYEIRREVWPTEEHLVTLLETLDVLASPQFMAAVRKHRLADIAFAECGRFV